MGLGIGCAVAFVALVSVSGCNDSRTAKLADCLDALPSDYALLDRVVGARLDQGGGSGLNFGHDCAHGQGGFASWNPSTPLAKAASLFEAAGWTAQPGPDVGPNQIRLVRVEDGRHFVVSIECPSVEGAGIRTGNDHGCTGRAGLE